MHCAVDSSGEASSAETLHPGLEYTSAYYEEQLYCETPEEPPTVCRHQIKATIVAPVPPVVSAQENQPVRIHDRLVVNIDLPPLVWHGYKKVPKILSLTNTGRTILINGEWVQGRPFITGGPLNGTYLFSQIHFHSPSEHEINGKRYPLEMHVVHYKTSYLTQERAMQEKDGTVVLVYLFQVIDSHETAMSSLTRLTPKIEKVNSRTETTDVCLGQILEPFTSKYFVYWGSIVTGKCSYLLQWIVSGYVHSVTQDEANELLGILNTCCPAFPKTPRMKPENDTIFYVEEIVGEGAEEQTSQIEYRHYPHFCQEVTTTPPPCPKKPEECKSQPALFGRPIKSYSGLRMTTAEKPKCDRRRFYEIRVETPSSLSQEQCRLKKKVYVKECEETLSKTKCCATQETISCPFVPPCCPPPAVCCEPEPCENVKEVKDIKLKVISSCPSVSEGPCDDKKKKKKYTCEFKTDIQVNLKKLKQKKKKTKKDDSCESEGESSVSACTSKKSVSKKEKKKKEKKSKKSEETEESEHEKESHSDKHHKKKKKHAEDCDTGKKTSESEGESKKSSKTHKKSSKKIGEKTSDTNVKDDAKEKDQGEKIPEEKDNPEEGLSQTDKKTKKEVPVECIIATVPEKSFEEILREYDNNWLSESALKMQKSSFLDFNEGCDKENTKSSDSKKSTDREKKLMTTLFEKIRNSKVSETPTQDSGVNFLLKPNDRQSNPSSSVMSPKSYSEEIKCENQNSSKKNIIIPETINTATVPVIDFHGELATTNEFSVQVDLLYNSKNPKFSECSSQEYNLALMYNQNILQEYKGIIQPETLKTGNYEKLNLIPKYPELGNVSVSLQDCIIKKDSSGKISMRAKFLMKELQFKYIDLSVNKKGGDDPEKKFIVLRDATTQCLLRNANEISAFTNIPHHIPNLKETLGPAEEHTEEELHPEHEHKEGLPEEQEHKEGLHKEQEHKEDKHKEDLPEEDEDKADVHEEFVDKGDSGKEREHNGDLHNEDEHKENSYKEHKNKVNKDDKNNGAEGFMKSRSYEQINLTDEQKKNDLNDKLIMKPDTDSEESSKKSDSLVDLTKTRKSECTKEEITKKTVKELKHLFSNRKKTVYFMYEKIEKDESSGKKIFVGSFRPKEEVKCLFKGRKAGKSTNSSDETEGGNKNSPLLSKESMSDDLSGCENSNENYSKSQTSGQNKHSVDDTKELVTLHKFKTKNVAENSSAKDRLCLVFGKALTPLQKESRSFKRLADLVGLDESENSKISVYELQEPSENENAESVLNEKEQESKCKNYVVVSNISNLEKPNESEPGSKTGSEKKIAKKSSQTAVIIIPVEVESLSKVEVILVEHSENSKRTVVKNGKDAIPCSNFTE